MNLSVLAMWMPGPMEWAAILVVGLLLFGRRLPEIARSMGKSIVEFKRGLREVKDDIDTSARIDAAPSAKLERPPDVPSPSPPPPEPAPESPPAPK